MYDEIPSADHLSSSAGVDSSEYRQYFEQYYAGYIENQIPQDPYAEYASFPQGQSYGYYGQGPELYYQPNYAAIDQNYYVLPAEVHHQPQYYSAYGPEYVSTDGPPPGYEHLLDCRSSDMASELIEDIEE
jgi:hypothetical protein